MTFFDGMLTFKTNANKDYLRSKYDKPIIEAWFKGRQERLHYLGLPGPELLDIVEWQDFIGKFSTIERSENEQHLIFLRANVHDIEHRLHSLYGEFDTILLTGRDKYNHAPRWPYDLVNLDFFGGLLYSDLARPKALKKLIENQDAFGRSFLLITTYHIRDTDLTGEKYSLLGDLERKLLRDIGNDVQVAKWAAWYRKDSTPDVARQSLYLNTILHEEGEAAHFRVRSRPPILYTGTSRARMLHFVTEFEHQKHAHRAVSDQSLLDVANLGYTELDNGNLAEPVSIPRIGTPRDRLKPR